MALIIKKLLKSNDFEKSVNELNEKQLTQVIKFASDKYYNQTPVISDEQFDYIKDTLNNLNPTASVLKEVGAEPKKKKIDLDYWLGSMEKIKPDTGGLEKWQVKYKPPYNISDKLDGVSCLLVYKNDETITMATRGTAEVGTDISNLYEHLNLPSHKKIKEYCSKNDLSGDKNLIAFRGELIMPLETFNKKWKDTFSNPRNTISGIVTSKKLNIELIKDINFVCYEIIDPFYSINIQLEHIKKIGLKTVSNYNYNKELSYEYLSGVLKDRMQMSEYEIDGIIITSITNKVRNTKSNPDYAFAFKDIFEIATTTVIKVEWNETKDGYLAPTIIIEPVKLDVEINRVTGIHAKNIVTNNIGKGTILEIIRSGKVIPKVHNIVKATKADLPKDVKYHWDDTKTNFILDDVGSSSKVSIENIYYWFSSMDTKGLGLKNVEKLYENGFNTVKLIMEAKPTDLVLKADLGAKISLNIVNAIKEAMSNTTLSKVMSSSNKLGRGVGEERIKLVLDKYPNLLTDYKKWSNEKFISNLKEINGWGEEISNLFVKNFSEFIEFYDEIKHLITFKKAVVKSNNLSNKIFVFTGFRDAEIKKKIEEMGGKVSDTVSSKTNYLVVKSKDEIDNPTSKITKALENGIDLITKEKLLKMLE